MSDSKEIVYGPLEGLIGEWHGDKGLDIAPEPEGAESNPYYETLTFTAIGDVTNAEFQVLTVLHYRQIVQHKSNDKVFHDQTGYWMWDASTDVIMHSLTIPRGVSVLAGGVYTGEKEDDGRIVLEVVAGLNNKDWKIIQSPFMQDNARTTDYCQHISLGKDKLSYSQTTTIEIYGKVFEHTDQNELIR